MLKAIHANLLQGCGGAVPKKRFQIAEISGDLDFFDVRR